MSVKVQFNGYPHSKDGHGYPAKSAPINPPPRPRTAKDNAGNKQTELVYGWQTGDVVTFDADLATQNGRDPANDGADCAELFVATENIGYEQAETPPFSLVTTKQTTAAAGKDR